MKKAIAVIITDTHLSENNIDVIKSVFQQTIDIAKNLGLKNIEHGGDIFHSRKGQLQVNLTAFQEILDNLQDHEIRLNQVVGNHDKSEYSIKQSFLDPFKHHPALMLYPIAGGRPLTKNIFLSYLSYFTDEIYKENLLDIIENGGSKEINVLLTHIGVNGATMGSGVVIESETIVPSIFNHWDLTLIGHYHDAQLLAEGKIKYIGSAIQHNFGETTGKGATVLYDDLSTEVIPLKYPQYLKFEVNPASITASDISDLKKEKTNSGDFLRVILTGSEAEVKSFNKMDLMNAGISVELKQDKIIKEEIETTLEAFDTKSLKDEFDQFCKRHKLDEMVGKKYFDLILKERA